MNINKNPQHKARLSKNGFDISKSTFFTSSVGQLLPTYWDFLSPGDSLKFSVDMFTRTETMLSPAFMKLRHVTRFFFVPLQQIYAPFGSLFYGIDDVSSSQFVTENLADSIPMVNSTDVQQYFIDNPNYYDTSSSSHIRDQEGYSHFLGAKRLSELFHYSNFLHDSSQQLSNQYLINPLLACAYQKIYFDKFRLSDREANDRFAYSLDKYYISAQIDAATFIRHMMTIRYAHYDKDFFINNVPAPLVNGGSTGMLSSANLADVNQWLNEGNYTQMFSPSIRGNQSVSGSQPSNSTTSANQAQYIENRIGQALQTSNIRSMFAIEKLAEITRRAAKHYDAQTLAHFGYDVPTGISGEVYELGSYSNFIQMSDIAATADSAAIGDLPGRQVGDLAGRGNGFGSGKPNKFTAPCHGIFMAISYAIPDVAYNGAICMARENTYHSRVDFYQPEFDRLGMQPLFYYQGVFDKNVAPPITNTIIGWQYRYAELKQKFNAAYGAFNSTRATWIAKRLQNPNSSALVNYLVPANFLNKQFTVDYDGTFEHDPLNNWFEFKVYKSSVMSTYGLPSL